MTVPYALRLLCISLAVFFLVHLAVGTLVALLTPAVSRLARRVPAVKATRLLFVLRLYPVAASVLIVLGLCVPSFLWFESETGGEEIGLLCLAAAALAAALWSISICRAVRAIVRSARYLRHCREAARRVSLSREPAPVWILNRPEPFLMLAGLFRPELMISRGVVDALTPEQLAAALEHERAHCNGRDNLKRLVMLLLPGLLPGIHGFGRLESDWARLIEWAADDRAVAGDACLSVSLAAALVRVARMGVVCPPEALVTSLMADGQDLSVRVERLLHGGLPREFPKAWTAATLVFPGLLLLIALQPASTLQSVQHVIERLVR